MPSDLDIMKNHVYALFTRDERGRLLRVNEAGGGAEAPRFFLGRTKAGNVPGFRHDLPETLVEELEAVCVREPPADGVGREPEHVAEYLRLLETHSPVQKVSMGPAYVFPDTFMRPRAQAVTVIDENAGVLNGGLEAWVPDIVSSPPLMAILNEGHAVAVCGSVRITPVAHEAGVETLATHRGKGYAADVAAQWAEAVRQLGCTPLYSTSWENTASQRVAKKLGLRKYGVDFHVG